MAIKKKFTYNGLVFKVKLKHDADGKDCERCAFWGESLCGEAPPCHASDAHPSGYWKVIHVRSGL